MVRRAVLAAQDAACAILHAVAGGVGDRRFRDLDREFEIAPRAAAKLPPAAAIRPELVPPEKQREANLRHFQAAELDAACGLPLACARPAVAGRRCPAARPRLEHVPDKRFAGSRVDALNGNAE